MNDQSQFINRRNNAVSEDNSTSWNLPSTSGEQNREETEDEAMEGATESDDGDSSDESLPDLNDPSWGKEEKKKIEKTQKRKKRSQKIHPKLMKTARKVFEQKSVMYKLSQEFIKSSKANKEILNEESQSHHKDMLDNQYVSTVNDHHHSDTVPESPVHTPVSSRNDSPVEKTNLSPQDNTGAGLQPSGTWEATTSNLKANNETESPLVLLDSEDSDTTVIFEDRSLHDICHIESVHSLSAELSDDDGLTSFAENTTRPKRKEYPSGSSNSNEGNKKMRKSKQNADVQNDVTEHPPMVTIPVNVTSKELCSGSKLPIPVTTLSQTDRPQQIQSDPVISAVGSHSDTTPSMAIKENSPTSIGEGPSSRLFRILSSEITRTSVERPYPLKHLICSSSTPQEESTVVDGHTPCESNKGSVDNASCGDENICVTGKVSGDVDQNKSPVGSNNVTANPLTESHNERRDVKVTTNSVGNPLKSLIQMSMQFQELTTKRADLEDNIRQVKEEYDKKLQALEEQKKIFDVDIKKLVDAMSAWKELSEEDQLSSGEQQQDAATSPTCKYCL